MHLQLLSVRTNPSFTGLNMPLLLPLNDSPHKSPGGFSFPPRRPEYTVGRHNGSVLQLRYSHSFFVQHVRCLFFPPSTSFKETKPALLYSHRCKRHNGYLAARDPVLYQMLSGAKVAHLPPTSLRLKDRLFLAVERSAPAPPALELELLFRSLNLALTAAHELSILRSNSVHGGVIMKKKQTYTVVGSHSIISLILTKSRRRKEGKKAKKNLVWPVWCH